MNNKKKDEISARVKELFGNYGTITKITNNKILAYVFLFDSGKIFESDDILGHMGETRFLLVAKSINECFIYCFIGGKKGILGDEVLHIINNTNVSLEYGKFYLDSDNDISWEYKLDLDKLEKKDITNILNAFSISLLKLYVNINEKLIAKKEEKRHE